MKQKTSCKSLQNNKGSKKNLGSSTTLIILLLLSASEVLSFFPKCPRGCSTCKSQIKPVHRNHENSEEEGKNENAEQEKPEEEEDEVVCLTCELTYRLKKSRCYHCNIENCARCEESPDRCDECMREHYVSGFKDQECKNCPENCEFCENSRSCQKCLFGYKFDDKKLRCEFSYIAFTEILAVLFAIFFVMFLIWKFGLSRFVDAEDQEDTRGIIDSSVRMGEGGLGKLKKRSVKEIGK